MKKNTVFTKPSFWGLTMTGLLMLIIIIVVVQNIRELKKLDAYKMIVILCLISLAIGVHSLIHLGLEYIYNYNPMEDPLNVNVNVNI